MIYIMKFTRKKHKILTISILSFYQHKKVNKLFHLQNIISLQKLNNERS